jgi:hypothetical protein
MRQGKSLPMRVIAPIHDRVPRALVLAAVRAHRWWEIRLQIPETQMRDHCA